MKKRIISLLLLLVLMSQLAVFADDSKMYSDDGVKELVGTLSTLGIFSSFDDEVFFDETAEVKREEAAKAFQSLLNMEELTTGSEIDGLYIDVPPYRESIKEIALVVQLGIMTGSGNGLFEPEGNMKVEHFLKGMIVALGYKWKAERFGGYPSGYIRVANELGLMNGVNTGVTDILTRADLLYILHNALYVPICVSTTMSAENVSYEINEDVTALTEYHNIYTEKGIVATNKSATINSGFAPDEEYVMIDDLQVYVNGFTDIYLYFGCEVEYFYKLDEKNEDKYLVHATLTKNNSVDYILSKDLVDFKSNEIIYVDENGDDEELKISSNAVVIYNGGIATKNIYEKLSSFTGILKAIDNDKDDEADVVIINDYVYDKVESVDGKTGKVYGENSVYDLEKYKRVSVILGATNTECNFTEISAGDIIGFGESENKDCASIKIIRGIAGVTVASVSDDSFVLSDEREIYIPDWLNEEQKAKIKPNAEVGLALDNESYAVWIDEVENKMKIGYITAGNRKKVIGGDIELTAIKILDTQSTVKVYDLTDKEKIRINGKSVKLDSAYNVLAEIKSDHSLGGDGDISQVIYYNTDEEGNLSEIYTLSNSEDSKLHIKYNYKEDGTARTRNNGYDSGMYSVDVEPYRYAYALTNTYPVFRVPEIDQETSPDNFFAKKVFTQSNFPWGGGYKFDTYVADEEDIIPTAMVVYKTVTNEKPKRRSLMVIEKVSQVATESENLWQITGGYGRGITSFMVDSSIDLSLLKAEPSNPNENAGLTAGDCVWFTQDAADKITYIEKVFDFETEAIEDNLEAATTDADDAVRFVHIYNAPSGSNFAEGYLEDLSAGVPSEDNMVLVNTTQTKKQASSIFTFDVTNEKVIVGQSGELVDYQRDSVNYSKVLIRYSSDYFEGIIVYKY